MKHQLSVGGLVAPSQLARHHLANVKGKPAFDYCAVCNRDERSLSCSSHLSGFYCAECSFQGLQQRQICNTVCLQQPDHVPQSDAGRNFVFLGVLSAARAATEACLGTNLLSPSETNRQSCKMWSGQRTFFGKVSQHGM